MNNFYYLITTEDKKFTEGVNKCNSIIVQCELNQLESGGCNSGIYQGYVGLYCYVNNIIPLSNPNKFSCRRIWSPATVVKLHDIDGIKIVNFDNTILEFKKTYKIKADL